MLLDKKFTSSNLHSPHHWSHPTQGWKISTFSRNFSTPLFLLLCSKIQLQKRPFGPQFRDSELLHILFLPVCPHRKVPRVPNFKANSKIKFDKIWDQKNVADHSRAYSLYHSPADLLVGSLCVQTYEFTLHFNYLLVYMFDSLVWTRL